MVSGITVNLCGVPDDGVDEGGGKPPTEGSPPPAFALLSEDDLSHGHNSRNDHNFRNDGHNF